MHSLADIKEIIKGPQGHHLFITHAVKGPVGIADICLKLSKTGINLSLSGTGLLRVPGNTFRNDTGNISNGILSLLGSGTGSLPYFFPGPFHKAKG